MGIESETNDVLLLSEDMLGGGLLGDRFDPHRPPIAAPARPGVGRVEIDTLGEHGVDRSIQSCRPCRGVVSRLWGHGVAELAQNIETVPCRLPGRQRSDHVCDLDRWHLARVVAGVVDSGHDNGGRVDTDRASLDLPPCPQICDAEPGLAVAGVDSGFAFDPLVLRQRADEVTAAMRENPNTRGTNDNWNESVKVLRLEVDQSKARALGVTSQSIAQASKTILAGTTVGQFREGDKLIDIVLRQPLDERN